MGAPEIAEPEVGLQEIEAPQTDYLVDADEVPQVEPLAEQSEGAFENFLVQAEQPVPDYVVPSVELLQPTLPEDVEANLNYTLSSPAGDPGTIDQILGSDLPNIPEPSPEPFIAGTPSPEMDAVSVAPALDVEQPPRQVYQGPASFDPAILGGDQDTDLETALPTVAEYNTADVIDEGIQPAAVAADEPEVLFQTAEQQVAPAYDAPMTSAPAIPGDLDGLSTNVVPETAAPESATPPSIPDLSDALPPLAAEQPEALAQPEFSIGVEPNELLPAEAPVEVSADPLCAAQADNDQDFEENGLPAAQLDQTQPEIPIDSAEDAHPPTEEAAADIEEQGLFDSALDEFKETNLSVEQLLAEITGEPIPSPVQEPQVADDNKSDDQEAVEGTDKVSGATHFNSSTEPETDVETDETLQSEVLEPVEAELELDSADTSNSTGEDQPEVAAIEMTEIEAEDPAEVVVIDPAEAETEDQVEVAAIERTEVGFEDPAEVVVIDQTETETEGQPEVVVIDQAEAETEDQAEAENQADVVATDQAEAETENQAEVVAIDQTEVETEEQAEVVAIDQTEAKTEERVEVAAVDQAEIETADRDEAATIDQTDAKTADQAEAQDNAAVDVVEEEPTDAPAVAGAKDEPETVAQDKGAQDSVVSKSDEPEPEAEVQTGQSSNWPTEEAKVQDDEFAAHKIDPQAGETARMLLDIMSKPSGAAQPQERALAADTLLRLVPKIPVANLITLAERICMMEQPPALLVNKMLKHPRPEVAGPLLEGCVGISDQVLMEVISSGDLDKEKMIARRRSLTPTMCDELLEHGDASVYLTIVRNPGASISHEAFRKLSDFAKNQAALQAPLVTRGDTPAPIAFELFWFLPSELRRYVLSRFLTDSETLDKILKITLAVDGSENSDGDQVETKFADPVRMAEFVTLIEQGEIESGVELLAELAGINTSNASRVINDSEGEPITVAMKAIGFARTEYSKVVERWRATNSILSESQRPTTELQNLFDSLSFNKARMLLTYWDWAADSSGPYALKAA